MDCGCSDEIDNAIDQEALGDGRALKREAGSLITAWKGSSPLTSIHHLYLLHE